jgi:DNA-binding CsgD family transcriptional regulator
VRSGSVREAAALLERAAASTTDPDVRAVLLAEALHATLFLADGAAAGRLADELTSAVAATTSTRSRAIGTVAAGMAKVMAGRGGIEELRAAVPLLAGIPDPQLDARGASWLMYAPLFIRDAETGRGLRARVDEARERAGVGTLPGLLFLVARDGAASDSWARAAADYTEAIRLARDTGQTTELAMSLAGLSWLESRSGQEAECRAHAAEALTLCASRDIHWGAAWALFSLSDLELSLGDAGKALEHLQELDELLVARSVGDPDLSPRAELVDVLLRLGRVDEATRTAAAYVEAADAKGQPWARARARRCLGLVATDDFDDPFVEALALHEETLDRFEAARTALAYGVRLRRAGRRVDARVQLRRALDDFTRLGAEVWADQAATELDLTGERVPPRALGGIAALTPQELQVALLLADGRTTREAAAALFLSPKTVEYHLRKVYTKLGVRSREELAEVVSTA